MTDQTARSLQAGSVLMPEELQVGPDDDRPARSDRAGALWILIDELRQQIDAVDATLLHALAQRMSLVRQIGRHKKAASIATVQIDRWMKLLEHRLALGRNLTLREDFVLALFELIHQEAVQVQDDLMHPSLERASQS